MDNVPAPVQALLPYLKWLASLIVVVVAAAATVVTLPGWAVLLGAVAASAGVYFAKNQAKPEPLKLVTSPEEVKEIRDALRESLHGLNDLNGPEPHLPVINVPASDVSVTAVGVGGDGGKPWRNEIPAIKPLIPDHPDGSFGGSPAPSGRPSLGALPPEGSGIVPGDTAADVERKLDALKRKGPE